MIGPTAPRLVVFVVMFTGAQAACSPPDKPQVKDDSDAAAVNDGCPSFARRDDGTCCAKSEVYNYEDDSCVAHGPPGCDLAAAAKGVLCTPRWCGALRNTAGQPCATPGPSCFEVGADCDDSDAIADPACHAGTWRREPGGPCVPAGLSAKPFGAPVKPVGVPWDGPLPPLDQTRFCGDGAAIRLCGSDEKGCGPGAMPNPDKAGACIKVGRPWTCPPGFVSKTNGKLAPCVPDPKDCDGPWPPSGGGPLLHVDNNAAPGGDGTETKPFVSIAAAVTEAEAGATIIVGPGVYAESVVITRSVTLVGRCAAKVTIDGSGGFATLQVAGPAHPKAQVLVRGLTLVGKARGLHVGGDSDVRAERLYIREARGIGMRAWQSGASLEASGIVITATSKGPKFNGEAVLVDEGARAELRDVWIHRGVFRGLLVRDVGTDVKAERVVISHTEALPQSDGGSGIAVRHGAKLQMTTGRVSACSAGGVQVDGLGSHAVLRGVIVDGARPNRSDGPGGHGIVVYYGASLDLIGVRSHDNRVSGVHVQEKGSKLTARGLIVDGTRKTLFAKSGGLRVYKGAEATVDDARLSGNLGFGARTAVGQAKLSMSRVLVDRSTSSGSHCRGCGLDVSPQSNAVITNVRLSANRSAGLVVGGDSARATATHLLVDGTRPPAADPDVPGYGVIAHTGGTLVLRGARLVDNQLLAARVLGTGSAMVGIGVVIDATRPDPQGRFGIGLQADSGGALLFAGSHLANNRAAGILAGSTATVVGLHGLIVEDTRPVQRAAKPGEKPTAEYGSGVYLIAGLLSAKISASVFRRNHMAGVQLVGANARISGCVVHDTVPSTGQWRNERDKTKFKSLFADGIVANGATGSRFDRNLLVNNKRAGLLIHEAKWVKVDNNALVLNTFGLVTQKSKELTIGLNAFIDNDQNRVGEGALALPSAPAGVEPKQ